MYRAWNDGGGITSIGTVIILINPSTLFDASLFNAPY